MTEITQERLSEWEALCEEATAGPWSVDGFHASAVIREIEPGTRKWSFVADADREHQRNENWRSDARFIAASREALPALIERVRSLEGSIRDIHWMARRYADGRSSYAPGLFNRATRALLAAGVALKEPHFARDGMGRTFDGLSDAEVDAAAADMPRGFAPEPDARLADALARIAALEGAVAASDERLRLAGERVGLPFGCDTAEAMADRIAALEEGLREIAQEDPMPPADTRLEDYAVELLSKRRRRARSLLEEKS